MLIRCGITSAGLTADGEDSPAAMEVAFKWIVLYGSILSVVLFVLWPLLALPAKVFSKGYFTFWVRNLYFQQTAVCTKRAIHAGNHCITRWSEAHCPKNRIYFPQSVQA